MAIAKIGKLKIPTNQLEVMNFIGGKFQQGKGHEAFVTSPCTGQRIAHFHQSTTQDLHEAVSAAQKAQREWERVPIKERCQVLFKAREIFLKRLEEISHLISSESGKTLGEAQAGLLKGIEVLEYALSLQNLDLGGRMEVSRGVSCEYQRYPVGVVAGITPFNFPAMVPMWMIPIAIALGNAFIWKPSDKTPITSGPLAQVFQEAGLPDGILSVIQGGSSTVENILDHPGISAVGFVGSAKVARLVYQRGTSHGKRVLALGGAKNHIILMPDADPDICVPGIVDSFTGCAGQRCMAASVLLAVGRDAAPLIEKIRKKAEEKILGQDMGAIITKDSLNSLHKAIERAQNEGAKLLLDGRNPALPQGFPYGGDGNWLAPTLLDHVSPSSQAATEELFGPVISIVHCENLTEALNVENACQYGNATSIFTYSGHLAERVAKEAKSGMVGVNIGVPVPREPFSFGGIQESKFGHGDITGASSLDFWTYLKKVTRKWNVQKDQSWMS